MTYEQLHAELSKWERQTSLLDPSKRAAKLKFDVEDSAAYAVSNILSPCLSLLMVRSSPFLTESAQRPIRRSCGRSTVVRKTETAVEKSTEELES